MNGARGRFGYAQARMQARLGDHGGLPELQRANEAMTIAAYLQRLRSSPWSRHVERLAPDMNVHEIERRLRDEWRATVDEVARWQPREWQPALQWLCWLPWLPALQKLARGGRAPGWTRDDEVLAHIVAAGRGAHATRLAASALHPLQHAVATDGDVVGAWLEHWRRLWPAEAARPALEAQIAATRRTAGRLAMDRASSADALRELRGALRRSFRRHPLSFAAAVAYVGLKALELLELRGAVVVRAAFPRAPA